LQIYLRESVSVLHILRSADDERNQIESKLTHRRRGGGGGNGIDASDSFMTFCTLIYIYIYILHYIYIAYIPEGRNGDLIYVACDLPTVTGLSNYNRLFLRDNNVKVCGAMYNKRHSYRRLLIAPLREINLPPIRPFNKLFNGVSHNTNYAN